MTATSRMTTPTRIYLIRNTETGDERLVRAAHASQARNHVARDTLTVEVASQEQLVALLTGDGTVAIEEAAASAEPAQPAPAQ